MMIDRWDIPIIVEKITSDDVRNLLFPPPLVTFHIGRDTKLGQFLNKTLRTYLYDKRARALEYERFRKCREIIFVPL